MNTTQQPAKKAPKADTSKTDATLSIAELSPFEANLRKQIRNLNKKLDQIAELQTKIKKEKFVPNDAQKDKISQKE